ncbi:MAG: hypothetical protein RBS17_09495 [Coriobacteriia bacterium]|nr:hypothetical protein [Coriobacteriia bacterium]
MKRAIVGLAACMLAAMIWVPSAWAVNGTYTDNVRMTANYVYGNQARIAVLNPYVYPDSYKVESLGAARSDATAWVEVGWCKYGTAWSGQPQVPTMFYAVYNNGYYEDVDIAAVEVDSAHYYAMKYVGEDLNGSSKWNFYLDDVYKGYEVVIDGRLSSAIALSQSETHFQIPPSQYDDAKAHFYGMSYYDGSVWRPWNSLASNVDTNPLFCVLKVSNTEWWNLHP